MPGHGSPSLLSALKLREEFYVVAELRRHHDRDRAFLRPVRANWKAAASADWTDSPSKKCEHLSGKDRHSGCPPVKCSSSGKRAANCDQTLLHIRRHGSPQSAQAPPRLRSQAITVPPASRCRVGRVAVSSPDVQAPGTAPGRHAPRTSRATGAGSLVIIPIAFAGER